MSGSAFEMEKNDPPPGEGGGLMLRWCIRRLLQIGQYLAYLFYVREYTGVVRDPLVPDLALVIDNEGGPFCHTVKGA